MPDEITFRLDRRIIPEEQPEEVEAELHALIDASTARLTGIRVEITRIDRHHQRIEMLWQLSGAGTMHDTRDAG